MKAKLISKSEVDAGGNVEILFEGWENNTLVYPFLRAICNPENIEQRMVNIILDLQSKKEIAEEIPVGLEVEIPND